MGPIVLAFVSVTLVGAVSLAGMLTLSMSEARVRRLATFFVSFAVGALLGDTFIHLVPEIFAGARGPDALRASLVILGGMLLFFVVEKLLRHQHGLLHRHHHQEHLERPALAGVNILGDAIHNYIDGLLIGASWLMPLTGSYKSCLTTTASFRSLIRPRSNLRDYSPKSPPRSSSTRSSPVQVRKQTTRSCASSGITGACSGSHRKP